VPWKLKLALAEGEGHLDRAAGRCDRRWDNSEQAANPSCRNVSLLEILSLKDNRSTPRHKIWPTHGTLLGNDPTWRTQAIND
jgi:hypothetical protein